MWPTRCASIQTPQALIPNYTTEQEDRCFVAYVITQRGPHISTTDSFEKVCVDSRLYSLSNPVTTRQRHRSGEALGQLTRRVAIKKIEHEHNTVSLASSQHFLTTHKAHRRATSSDRTKRMIPDGEWELMIRTMNPCSSSQVLIEESGLKRQLLLHQVDKLEGVSIGHCKQVFHLKRFQQPCNFSETVCWHHLFQILLDICEPAPTLL